MSGLVVGLHDPLTDLNAVTSTGAGAGVLTSKSKFTTWTVKAASVTTGGTVLIQGTLNGTDWYTISTVTVSANGTQVVSVANQLHAQQRSNLSVRTDGTYTTQYATSSGS